MKTLKKLLAVGLILTAVNLKADQTWPDHVDPIFEGLDGIEAGLLADKALYAQWKVDIANLHGDFDGMEAARASVFECIRDKFNKLNQDIADCNLSKQELEDQLNLKIRELEAELAALKLSTTQEIEQLKAEKEQLEIDLQEAREAYATLAALNEETALKLITELNQAKAAYSLMIEERDAFINNLTSFKDRMNAFVHKHKVDHQEIANEICGADAPNIQAIFNGDNGDNGDNGNNGNNSNS